MQGAVVLPSTYLPDWAKRAEIGGGVPLTLTTTNAGNALSYSPNVVSAGSSVMNFNAGGLMSR